eukprot:gene2888-3155_t
MFAGIYQKGSNGVEIFSPTGKEPFKYASCRTDISGRSYDRSIKGYSIPLDYDSQSPSFQMPRKDSESLGIIQSILCIQLKRFPRKNCSLELILRDQAKQRRRLHFSTKFREHTSNHLHAQLPWTLPPDVEEEFWITWIIDLNMICDVCFQSSFSSLEQIKFYGSSHLRKIFSIPHSNLDGISEASQILIPALMDFPVGTQATRVLLGVQLLDEPEKLSQLSERKNSSIKSTSSQLGVVGVKAISRKPPMLMSNTRTQKAQLGAMGETQQLHDSSFVGSMAQGEKEGEKGVSISQGRNDGVLKADAKARLAKLNAKLTTVVEYQESDVPSKFYPSDAAFVDTKRQVKSVPSTTLLGREVEDDKAVRSFNVKAEARSPERLQTRPSFVVEIQHSSQVSEALFRSRDVGAPIQVNAAQMPEPESLSQAFNRGIYNDFVSDDLQVSRPLSLPLIAEEEERPHGTDAPPGGNNDYQTLSHYEEKEISRNPHTVNSMQFCFDDLDESDGDDNGFRSLKDFNKNQFRLNDNDHNRTQDSDLLLFDGDFKSSSTSHKQDIIQPLDLMNSFNDVRSDYVDEDERRGSFVLDQNQWNKDSGHSERLKGYKQYSDALLDILIHNSKSSADVASHPLFEESQKLLLLLQNLEDGYVATYGFNQFQSRLGDFTS